MFRRDKKILSTVLLLCYLLFISQISTAALPNFQISPSRFELLINPSSRTIETITISNFGDETLKAVATTRDWQLNEKSELLLREPAVSPHSASNWIRFNPKQISIPPGEEQTIRFAITAPPGVEPGEYRTSILLTTEQEIEQDVQFKIRPQYAILVYVNIPEVSRRGELKDIEMKVNELGEYTATGNLYSTGNAHIRVLGQYNLTDKLGAVIKSDDLGKKIVLPGGSIPFNVNFGTLESGSYKLDIVCTYLPAFYMEGELDEYPAGTMEKEIEFDVP